MTMHSPLHLPLNVILKPASSTINTCDTSRHTNMHDNSVRIYVRYILSLRISFKVAIIQIRTADGEKLFEYE